LVTCPSGITLVKNVAHGPKTVTHLTAVSVKQIRKVPCLLVQMGRTSRWAREFMCYVRNFSLLFQFTYAHIAYILRLMLSSAGGLGSWASTVAEFLPGLRRAYEKARALRGLSPPQRHPTIEIHHSRAYLPGSRCALTLTMRLGALLPRRSPWCPFNQARSRGSPFRA
jgi:hypothetical protein